MEKAAVSGFECQPAGRLNRSVPWAGPFTLLCTVQAKAKDAAPTGTAPAEGATVTEMAGPTSSGCGTMPRPEMRSTVWTTCERCTAAPR